MLVRLREHDRHAGRRHAPRPRRHLAPLVSKRIPPEQVMHRLYRTLAVASSQVLLVSTVLSAQSISFGLRGSGSFPTGSFAQQQTTAPSSDVVLEGAKSGFGYGLDVGLGVGPIGIYA